MARSGDRPQRGGYAGALRMQVGATSVNEIYYYHTDHLGSMSAMSYGSGANTGQLVAGSLARYTPFGDWRTEPTADLTDRGFTGHMSNNTGSNDLGLIYMNARFYVSGISRFASADTITPDPMNPQSLNRYTYVRNSPINRTDPSGHLDCGDSRLPGDDQWCAAKPPTRVTKPEPPCQEAWCNNGPEGLPINNWNPENSTNEFREGRTAQVLDWLSEYEGPNWWGGPPGSMPNQQQLIAWLLFEEGSMFRNNNEIMTLMVQIIYSRLGDNPTVTELSGFTPFFDPNGGNIFDQADWNELVHFTIDGNLQDIGPYLQIVSNIFEIDESPEGPPDVRFWWQPWEAPSTNPDAVYKTIYNNGVPIFYFGTYSQAQNAGFIK